jgi:DNA-directed RNA polymerase subunit alpha
MMKASNDNGTFFRRVDALELSLWSTNCLINDGIVYVSDLVRKTEAELLRMPNFGRNQLNEIKDALAQVGLRLGMDVPDVPPETLEERST